MQNTPVLTLAEVSIDSETQQTLRIGIAVLTVAAIADKLIARPV